MSSEFKGILAPIDDSTNSGRALNKAIALANVTNSKLTLVNVVSYPENLKLSSVQKKQLTQKANQFLDSKIKYAQRASIVPDKKILYGNTVEQLLKLLNKKKYDLVVVGRRGTSRHSGSVLGSVSHALVHRSKVPVLVAT